MPRIALAQIDVTVGDIDGNSARAARAIEDASAAGAALVLLPEMTLTGYPPEDLVAREHFVCDVAAALERLAEAAGGIDAIVGFVERDGDTLHNAAALLRGGAIEAVYRKRRLPNYGVFDEERHFEPGDSPLVFDIAGTPAACTICEDAWVPELVAEAASLGAQLVVNISASPFHAGKGETRERMLAGRASESGVWFAYCNLVGGQDELVFDGRSAVFAPDGTVVARAHAFKEDLLVVDLPDADSPARVEVSPSGEEEVHAAIVLGLRDYFSKNGFTDAVVGLSGGIDSALTATLAVDALGPRHVHGVAMPSRYSSPGSIADAEALCANLGIECRTVPIEGPFASMLEVLEPSLDGSSPGITQENLQARVRGTLLMALSNEYGWIVLATGNKSELSVGYSTLYGDMVGGFAPLKDVYKTRVYSLARWRNGESGTIPEASLDKAPSAELRPEQLDTDSLPPYEVLDGVLRAYIEQDASREAIAASGADPALVERVCGLVDASEYKRRQGPMGIKITPKAFGRDRRMPVTNGYRG